MVGGVVLSSRGTYSTLAQTLCATGVVALYAVTFACHSIYHFAVLRAAGDVRADGMITATAFTLAVRLPALVVAILGMLGGFLTPVLLSTGQDNPAGLFGYIALLDVGLLLVANARGWRILAGLAALGTAVMQVRLGDQVPGAGRYFEGQKILIPRESWRFCGVVCRRGDLDAPP